jgi:hypothetical protein
MVSFVVKSLSANRSRLTFRQFFFRFIETSAYRIRFRRAPAALKQFCQIANGGNRARLILPGVFGTECDRIAVNIGPQQARNRGRASCPVMKANRM